MNYVPMRQSHSDDLRTLPIEASMISELRFNLFLSILRTPQVATSLLLFFLVAGSLSCFAQPRELPIVWGSFRTLSDGFTSGGPYSLAAKGDTIVQAALTMNGHNIPKAMIRVSGNDGISWSSWLFLNDTSDNHFHEFPYPVITSQGIMVMNTTAVLPEHYGLFRSSDLGQSWQRPSSIYSYGPFIQSQVGDTIIGSINTDTHDSATWISPTGFVLQPLRYFFDGLPNISYQVESYGSYSGNRDWLFGVCGYCDVGPYLATHVAFRRMSYNGRNLGTIHTFLDNTAYSICYKSEFDDEGNGVLAIATDTTGPLIDYLGITRVVTHDNGDSWTTPFTMTPVQSAGRWIFVNHFQQYWAIVWHDTDRTPGVDPVRYRTVEKVAFSPNHGYYWYPPVQTTIGDSSIPVRRNMAISVGPNYIRIYGQYQSHGLLYYFEKEGIFVRDSILPVLGNGTILPPSIPGDSVLPVSLIASDDDSIWNAILVVKRIGSLDSLLDTLRYVTQNRYTGTVTVPPR